jgi:hypothetical protein
MGPSARGITRWGIVKPEQNNLILFQTVYVPKNGSQFLA